MANRTVIKTWTAIGPWHLGPAAPNGSVRGVQERITTEYTAYIADYYGKGEKIYLDAKPTLQYVHNDQICFSRLPGSDDGHPERIWQIATRCGVTP